MTEQLFSKDFKQLVIAALVQDKKFLQTAAANLRPEHFEERIHSAAVEIIFNTYGKTKEPPSRVGLLTELINALAKSYRVKTDDQQSSMAVKPAEAFVDAIFKPIHGSIEDVKDKFLEYVKVQELKSAALEAYLGLENGSMSWVEAAEVVRRTEQRSNKTENKGIRAFGVADQLKAQFKENNKVRYSTGFPSIDRDMYGGPAAGTLTCFVSEAKGGKSMTLLQTAEANVRNGKNVLLLTLELPAEEIRRRFMSKITGIRYEELPERIEEVNKKMDSYYELHKGNIVITRFDAYTSCAEFRSYIYSLESSENFKPGVIIIDYGDLVRSGFRKSSDAEYLQQDSAFLELRNMMNEFNAAGFTASQSTREAMEKESVRMKDIAGSIGKARHSDHIITWSQSPSQKDLHQGNMSFVGTREGKSGRKYPIKTDYERCSMVERPRAGMGVDAGPIKPISSGPKWED